MKAYFLVPGPEGGAYELRDAPKPEAKGSLALIKVRAAGVNRGELLALPNVRSSNPGAKPMPSGAEFAGEIVEVGPDATGWHVGERVMGRVHGSYAEYMAVPAAHLMRIPGELSWAEAASIPNVFITAHDAVATAGGLQKGESVLVTAASSGVGTAAIQLARYLGAGKVLATTRSDDKAKALLDLGVDGVFNTRELGWVAQLHEATGERGVDVIIDSVGGSMLRDNIRALAVLGRLVSVGRNGGQHGDCDLETLAFKRASLIGVTFRTRSPQEAFLCGERFMNACLKAFGTGELKPVLSRAFPFERLGDAHRFMLDDGAVGKIVVTLD
jgi:NADPH:quinone reductase-like Zn-dependent oxidoreductase